MDVKELIDRGCRKHQAEMYEEAIEDFSAAIELDPEEAWAYHFRGWTYAVLQKFDDAIKDFTKAIKTDPNIKEDVDNLISNLDKQYKV